MKILVLINSLSNGGAERVTANLTSHWADRGMQVTIVTLTGQELDFYQLHPAVGRIALNVAGDSPNPLAAIFNNLRRVFALRRVLREIRPDVALGMMTTSNVLLILANIGRKETAVLGSERSYPPARLIGSYWESLRRWTYPHAEMIVMLTVEGLCWLNREIPKARGVVIPNPISYPLAANEPRQEPSAGLVPGRKLLLAVGRLSGEKGFDRLLKAFSTIAAANPLWNLIILGEGPLRPVLEAQVRVLGLEDRIFLPGRAGNVGDWYMRADLYVMSSRFEGFPNALGEAMAHGCAVVSYDCDTGPRDLIRDGEDGLLVTPVGDVAALAEALGRLMKNDELRERMAKNAIDVRERYSMQRVLAMWDKLFAEVKR